ncbi:MAG: hypothetical protein ACPLW7_03215 [Minisyncoccia bacterium]
MFISDIIPLTNLPFKTPQILSYYSVQEIKSGALVEIFLNKQKVNGIVYKTVDLKQRKAIIKKADFSLKKIQKIIYDKKLISNYLITLANFLSQYYLTPLSLALKTVLPKNIVSFARLLNKVNPNFTALDPKIDLNNNEYLVNNIFLKDAFLNLLKETQGQVLILVPTNFYEIYFTEILNRNFKDKLINFPRSNKMLTFLWDKLNKNEELIVIGNRSSIFLPFYHLTNIVIINPDNVSYKSFSQKPYYHTLDLAKKIASYYHAKITYYYHY